MTGSNPDDIFNDFRSGKIDKSYAINNLFSILRNSKNDQLRIQIIELLINNFLDEGVDILKWVIMNEKSQDCLLEFYQNLERSNSKKAENLKNLLLDTIGTNFIDRFKVNREEAYVIGLLDMPGYKVRTSEEGSWPHYISFTVEEEHVVGIFGFEIFPDLKLVKMFTKLRKLETYVTGTSDLKQLKHLKNLEYLKFDCVGISEGNGLQDFTSLKNLKELHLIDITSINFIKSMEGLKNLVNLEKLSITGEDTYEYRGEITTIQELENLVKLKELKLYSNKISEIECLDKLKNLELLDLGGNNIEKINGLNNLINLKELNLSNNHISQISGLESLTNLEILDLSNNKITKIEGLYNPKKLKKLYLCNNKLVKIQGLSNLSNLEELDIRNNEIEELRGLESLINLENLFIDGKKLSNIKYSNSMQGTWGVHHPDIFVESCRRIKIGDLTELDGYSTEELIDLYKNKKLHKRFWKGIESFILERGNDDLLLSFYELVVKTFPDRKLVWQLLASNYEKKKNQDKHIVALENIVLINPKDHKVWNKLVSLYYEKNDFHKVLDTYKRITVAFPLESKGWFDLANIYFENKKHKEALGAINRSLSLDSKYKAAIELKTTITKKFEK